MESTFVRLLVFPLLIALLILSLGPTPITHAATSNLNVDRFDDPAVTTPGSGAAACGTAANDCSLRGAILTANAASSGDYVIHLPTGTYSLTLAGASEDGNKTGDLDISRSVTIAGAGSAVTVINGNNVDRVFDIHVGNVSISGVTIKGGKAPDGITDMVMGIGGAGEHGGGIRNTSALTLTNCIVTANHAGAGGAGGLFAAIMPFQGGAGGAGGGIYNTGALTVVSTTVSSNGAGNGGVGASGPAAGALLTGAGGGSGGDGGGIYNSGTLTVTGTILQSNKAGDGGSGGAGSASIALPSGGGSGGGGGNGGNGGGIYNAGNQSLAGTAIASNETGNGGFGGSGGAGGLQTIAAMPGYSGGAGGAGGSGGNGSAIYNAGRTIVTNSTTSGNHARNGGGGGSGGAGGISTAGPGGGGGTGGNSGNGGSGGIYNGIFVNATITITSATIASNAAGTYSAPGSGGPGGTGTPNGSNGSSGSNGILGNGGGIDVYTGTLSLKNTMVALNSTSVGGLGPDCYGAITSQGYNFIRVLTNCAVGGTTTGNISGVDPKLNALADNGGETLTHALQPTSPARDAGDPAGCKDAAGSLLLVDQRGLPRAYGGRCDIGAFELQSSSLFLPLLRR